MEGPLPLGSNHICKRVQAYMPSPHTRWPRAPQKQHSEKTLNPGSTPDSSAMKPSRGLTKHPSIREQTTRIQSAACREIGENGSKKTKKRKLEGYT